MHVNKVDTNATSLRYPSAKTIGSVDTAIDSAINSAATAKAKIQIAGVLIGQWLGKHGDKPTACSQATRLVHGLGQGIKSEALIEYFRQLMGFVVGEVTVTSGNMTGELVQGFVDVDLKVLKENWNSTTRSPKTKHWVSFSKETEWGGFDFEKALGTLFKGVDTAVQKVATAKADGVDISAKVIVDFSRVNALKTLMSLSTTSLAALMSQAAQGLPLGDIDFDEGTEEEEVAA